MANIFGRDDIIRLLDNIRHKLLGDSLAVQKMALAFAENDILGATNANDISAATNVVSGTWTGRAADQFNAYAGRVGNALNSPQGAVASMSVILVEIANCVINTYKSAIEFVGACGTELSKIGIKGVLAALTVEVPIVDLFTAKDVIDTVIDAFSTLIDKVAVLFGESLTDLGKFAGGAISLQQADTNFPEIPEMAGNSGINNEKQWRVNPTAFPE
ncbi:hypothetical protein [Amycolatopsis saalfeldensis]|uniref:Proteins of 100 residues with WXG n=1 Tax=Amycolatopsis saalfeldensis TaxID=394193 RepID=A0A1H8Y4T5_9PSEU|nr:hypothetical protein [Amycolatopsis saalfeldensis]SEP47264.1 hypothetical protein SAMN04489732_11177 [Amycolatopsis saalfeldensis]